MRKMTRFKLPVALALAWPGAAWGADPGAEFLKIGVGARAIGMGSAYTAAASDATSLQWNPAGLSGLKARELALAHCEWILGSRHEFVGLGYPTSWGTLALGFSRLSELPLEGRTEKGGVAESFSSYGQSFGMGVAAPISRRTSAGLGVKFLESRIGGDLARSFAFDLGARHELEGVPLTLGLAALNLGPGLKFVGQRDRLPLTLSAGAAYRMLPGLTAAADFRHDVHAAVSETSFGAEYRVTPFAALRAGYLASWAPGGGLRLGGGSGLGAGFGVRVLKTEIDYAATPFGLLGTTHRVSLSFKF